MIVALLNRADAYRCQLILPGRAAQLLVKLITKNGGACITNRSISANFVLECEP